MPSLIAATLTIALLTLAAFPTQTRAQGEPAENWPAVDDLPVRPELPDPLVMFDGSPVETTRQWHEQRRPELLDLFAHYMYGRMPAAPPEVRSELLVRDDQALDGRATLEVRRLRFEGEPPTPVHLLLVIPNDAQGPTPVFFGLNFNGIHTVIDHPDIPITEAWVRGGDDHRATADDRGDSASRWPLHIPIENGYAVATVYCGEFSPDRNNAFHEGVHHDYLPADQQRPGPHEWTTIAAWAWGLHRVADYLHTDDRIDNEGLVVIGHSRLGKTSLLAGATDERIDIIIPSQAGCGGTAPNRFNVGESVERINTSFPHWFADTFKQFNTQVERLPFDQHCLIAACAPRPVLLTNAQEDEWADPVGQFNMLKAASPVYEFLGVEGLAQPDMPEPGRLIDSRLGYFIREGGHDMTETEWRIWLTFANRHLNR